MTLDRVFESFPIIDCNIEHPGRRVLSLVGINSISKYVLSRRVVSCACPHHNRILFRAGRRGETLLLDGAPLLHSISIDIFDGNRSRNNSSALTSRLRCLSWCPNDLYSISSHLERRADPAEGISSVLLETLICSFTSQEEVNKDEVSVSFAIVGLATVVKTRQEQAAVCQP